MLDTFSLQTCVIHCVIHQMLKKVITQDTSAAHIKIIIPMINQNIPFESLDIYLNTMWCPLLATVLRVGYMESDMMYVCEYAVQLSIVAQPCLRISDHVTCSLALMPKRSITF